MLKKILIVLLFFCFCTGHSQSPPKNQTGNSILNLVNTLDHDTCLDKKFSIVFYIVLDSTLSVRCATPSTLAAIIDTLNRTFKKICVSFVNCSTVFIPIYPYNKWKRTATEPVVLNNYYTERTINVFIVDSVKEEAYIEQRGYSFPPPLSPPASNVKKDIIVVEQFRASPPDYYHMFHNFGHFFGLVHTYDELNPSNPANPPPTGSVVTHEYADASNGCCHGDSIADTEADPGFVAQEKDGKGDRYIRPLDNYMSFFDLACHYTQGQFNVMARMIVRRRMYLH